MELSTLWYLLNYGWKIMGRGIAPFLGSVVAEYIWSEWYNDYWFTAKIQVFLLLSGSIFIWGQVLRQTNPEEQPWRKWGYVWMGIAVFQMFFSGFQGAVQAPSQVSIDCRPPYYGFLTVDELRDGIAVVKSKTKTFSPDQWLDGHYMKCMGVQDVYKIRFCATILYCLCNFGALWLTLVNVPIPVSNLLREWKVQRIFTAVGTWGILNSSLDDILWTVLYVTIGFVFYMYLVYRKWSNIQFTADDFWVLVSFSVVTLNFAFIVCLEWSRFADLRWVASLNVPETSWHGRFLQFLFWQLQPPKYRVETKVGHFTQLRYYSWFSWLHLFQKNGDAFQESLGALILRLLIWVFIYARLQEKIREHDEAMKKAACDAKEQIKDKILEFKTIGAKIGDIRDNWRRFVVHKRLTDGGWQRLLAELQQTCRGRCGQNHPSSQCDSAECKRYVSEHTAFMMELAYMQDLITSGKKVAANDSQRREMQNWSRIHESLLQEAFKFAPSSR